MTHHVSFHLFEDDFPSVLVLVGNGLHQRLHKILSRLDTENCQDGALRLDP